MKQLFKTLVALCCALFFLSMNLNAQSFTTTSAFSKVTGSSLVSFPSGGTINPGDIIVLPWNSNSTGTASSLGQFPLTAVPSGPSPRSYSWTTKGDIGLVGAGPFNTTTANVNTINEHNRNTTTDVGQSKGRVYFSWVDSPNVCGGQQIYFDVIKSFSGTNINDTGHVIPPSPAIIGPGCLQPNTIYTYSVDPIVSDNIFDQIGVDRYFWNLDSLIAAPYNAVIQYYSTDSSSITFKTGSSVPPKDTIKCYFGVANTAPWGTNTAYSTKALQAAVSTPTVTITGRGITSPTVLSSFPANVCDSTNSSTPFSNKLYFAVTPVAGYTYSWAWTPTTWVGNSPQPRSGPNDTITIDNNPGTVTLTSVGPCGDVVQSVININRQYNSTAMFTLSTTCITDSILTMTIAGGASSAGDLSTTPAFNPPSYTGLPTGWTASYTNLGVVTINTHNLPVPGNYTLSLQASPSPCIPAITYVVSKAPPVPVITPGTSTCGASLSTIPLSTTSYSGVNYVWAIGGTGVGFSLNSLSGSSVTATVGTSGFVTVTVRDTIAGASPQCGTTSRPDSLFITPATPAITGPSCFNWNWPSAANAYTFSVPLVTGATNYQWSVTGVSLVGSIANQGTHSVTLGVGATSAPFTVYCLITTPCGVLRDSIIETPAPLSTDTIYVSGAPHNTNYSFSPNDPLGTYQWYRDSAGIEVLLTGQTSDNYTATVTNGGVAQICCTATTTTGCIYTTLYCTATYHFKSLPAPGNGLPGSSNLGDMIKVFPNPNKGEFTLSLPQVKQNAIVTILDINGREITTKQVYEGDNSISQHGLAAGEYVLHIQIDGESTYKKIIIQDTNSK